LRLRRSSSAADSDKPLPEVTRACVAALGAQLRMLKAQILQFDHMIRAWQPKRYTWEIFSEGRTLSAEESTGQFLDF
jgi:hypothetical protein